MTGKATPSLGPNAELDIFSEALAISDKDERGRFVERSCRGDLAGLRDEILSLLDAHDEARDVFNAPFAVFPKQPLNQCEEDSNQASYPKTFGKYQLLKEIGRGGMGVVYAAREPSLDRVVALKMLRNGVLSTHQELHRFAREARAAGTLNHSGIVPVYETGSIDGQHYFTMGLLKATSLQAMIDQGTLTVPEAVSLMLKICSAVAYAHRQGIVHRDLKPANILVDEVESESLSGELVPKITDFGLARRTSVPEDITLTGEILGTPGFMAPEQVTSPKEVKETADVYALGAILFYCLSGRAPRHRSGTWEHMKQLVSEEFITLSDELKSVPKDLEVICEKCLRLQAKDRYQCAGELEADLKRFISGYPILARPASLPVRVWKMVARRPAMSLFTLLVMTLLLGGILVPLKLASTWKRAHRAAIHEQAKAVLNTGVMWSQRDGHVECLENFHKAAVLAREANDPRLEGIARWNLGSRRDDFWSYEHFATVEGSASRMELSPGGKFMLVAGDGGEVALLLASSGAILWKGENNKAPVSSLQFHPSGNSFVIGRSDGNVVCYSMRQSQNEEDVSVKYIRNLQKGSGPTRCLFLADGSILLTGDAKGQLTAWDWSLGEAISPPAKLQGGILSMVVTKSGLLFISCHIGSLSIWKVSGGLISRGSLDPGFKPGQLALGSDENHMFIERRGGFGGVMFKFSEDAADGHVLEKIRGLNHKSVIYGARFPRDGNTLFTGSRDGTVRCWDSRTLQEIREPIRVPVYVKSLVPSPSGTTLYQGVNDGRIIRWCGAKRKSALSLSLHSDLDGITFSPDGRAVLISPRPKALPLLYCRLSDGHIVKRPLDQKTDTHSVYIEKRIISRPKSRSYFVLERLPHKIREFDWETGRELAGIDAKLGVTIRAVLSHDQEFLAGYCRDKSWVYCFRSGEVIFLDYSVSGIFDSLCFSSDNQHVILAAEGGEISWYSVATGELVRREKAGAGRIEDLQVLPDQNLLAVANSDHTARVYKEDTFELVGPPLRHVSRVGLVRFANKGKFLISATKGKTLHIWDIESGITVSEIFNTPDRIRGLAINSDTGRFASIGKKGSFNLWEIPEKDERPLDLIEDWIEKKKHPQKF